MPSCRFEAGGSVKSQLFNFSATSRDDLYANLKSVDIAVPLISEGRKKWQRERYTISRFIATAARESLLQFPVEIKHQDETELGPDFYLSFFNVRIGIECVDAVPQELYRIEELRETEYPDELMWGQRYFPKERRYTDEERIEIASGQRVGTPWMPAMAKRDWLEAMHFFIDDKARKRSKGNYGSSVETWLLVEDAWPTPLRVYPESVRGAAVQLSEELTHSSMGHGFNAIYILSGTQLIRVAPGNIQAVVLEDLWHVPPTEQC